MRNLRRAFLVALGAVASGVLTAARLDWNPWVAFVAGVGIVLGTVAVWSALSAQSNSQQRFAARHGWGVHPDFDAVVREVLSDRRVDGQATDLMGGPWRGRLGVQFQARVHVDAIFSQQWFEAIAHDAAVPRVQLVPRWSWRWVKSPTSVESDAAEFSRAWRVYTDDAPSARQLLHRGMRDALMTGQARGRRITFTGSTVSCERAFFVPSAKGADERLDLLSDLADQVPRELVEPPFREALAEYRRSSHKLDAALRSSIDAEFAAREERVRRAPTAGLGGEHVEVARRPRQRTAAYVIGGAAVVILSVSAFVIWRAW